MAIIPWFGVPFSIQNANGSAVIAKVTQGVPDALGIHWKLHASYRSQSTEKQTTKRRIILKRKS